MEAGPSSDCRTSKNNRGLRRTQSIPRDKFEQLLIRLVQSGERFSKCDDTGIVRFARSRVVVRNGKSVQERSLTMFRPTMVAQDVSRHGVKPGKRIILRNLVEPSPCNLKGGRNEIIGIVL
jgi:hypothetical protein